MAELNHTIVWCSDKENSSRFLTEILGLPPPRTFFHFLVVDMANGVSLDFYQKEGSVSPQHYAFLVPEAEFDAVFARMKATGTPWWADPSRSRPNAINHHDGGRGHQCSTFSMIIFGHQSSPFSQWSDANF